MKLKPLHGTIGRRLVIHDAPRALKEEILRALTFRNPDYDSIKKFSPYANTRVPEFICMGAEVEDELWLPRGYDGHGLRGWSAARFRSIKWTYSTNRWPVVFPKKLLKPNAEQKVMLDALKKVHYANKRPAGNYLLLAGTGFGKTICGILCGAFLGHRVLVLCRTNLIRNAWQDDLYRVFGMNREQVGLIQQKTCRIGEHFTLATIATLGRRREKWRELFAQFGTVIIDEVHIIGSDTVHDIAANCGARYLIGLTATTKRADGKDYVLRHELGKKIVHVKNTGQETSSSLPIKDVQTIYTNFRYNPPSKRDIDIHEVNAKLVEDMERNRLIVDNAIKDFDEGHYVIVTSPVLNHLDVLRQMLKDRGYEFSLLTGETNANKFYTQNLIEGVLRGTVRGVLASQNAVKLGANINPLDRLHIAIPPSNPTDVEQLVGRIRRKAPGKVDALVRYYLDDKCAYLSRRYRKAFVPVMRKLHVRRFENMWIA